MTYSRRILFCSNLRKNGKPCCFDEKVNEYLNYAKEQLKNSDIMISLSGCLGYCYKGPIVIIYPASVRYTYKNKEDIDEIIKSVLENTLVEKLLI